jgi:hypothetical protein
MTKAGNCIFGAIPRQQCVVAASGRLACSDRVLRAAARGWNRMNAASTRYGRGGCRQPTGITGHGNRRDARAPGVRRWASGTSGRAGRGGARGRRGNPGINGGSSGKDGVITLGDHALVFSELRRVTCGVAVYKAVDNRCDVRITGGILWTRCGYERNLK